MGNRKRSRSSQKANQQPNIKAPAAICVERVISTDKLTLRSALSAACG